MGVSSHNLEVLKLEIRALGVEMISPARSLFSLDQVFSHQRTDTRQHTAVALSPYIRIPILALGTGLAYYFGTELGYRFTPSDHPIGTLWPPNAILLALLLLVPTRVWPFLLLGVLPAHLLAQLGRGVPLSAAIGWFFGNTSEALVGAACIRYFAKQERPFDSLRGIVAFLSFGVLLSTFITSFFDASVVVLTRQGNDYWMPWITRMSSNMISQLIFVPIIVLAGGQGIGWLRNASIGKWLEAMLLVSGTATVTLLVFGNGTLIRSFPALICVPLAFLLWAALRFDLIVLSTSLLVIAFISIWEAMRGHGILQRSSMTQNVLFLHFFLLGLTVPLVLLTGYMLEQRRTLAASVAMRDSLIGWQDREHQRVGRVLHNEIVQQLSLVAAEIDRMRVIGHLPGGTDLRTLYQDVTQVSDSTRDLSHELHPFVLEYAGLGLALRSLCRRAAEQSNIHIDFREQNVQGIQKESALALYRAAQEALQNIVKYSGARTATVDLTIAEGSAVLRIADDGVGIAAGKDVDQGIGLASMRARVSALNGHFEICSSETKGTIITAKLPVLTQSQRS